MSSEAEVFIWLEDQYRLDPERFFSTKEITEGLRDAGMGRWRSEHIRLSVINLIDSNLLELKESDLVRSWRLNVRIKVSDNIRQKLIYGKLTTKLPGGDFSGTK